MQTGFKTRLHNCDIQLFYMAFICNGVSFSNRKKNVFIDNLIRPLQQSLILILGSFSTIRSWSFIAGWWGRWREEAGKIFFNFFSMLRIHDPQQILPTTKATSHMQLKAVWSNKCIYTMAGMTLNSLEESAFNTQHCYFISLELYWRGFYFNPPMEGCYEKPLQFALTQGPLRSCRETKIRCLCEFLLSYNCSNKWQIYSTCFQQQSTPRRVYS